VSTETIRVGYTVVVTAVETGQVVVEAKVLDLDLLENGLYRKIVVKSTENKKCDEIRLAYFPSEGVWRVLSEDPFGPGETFSRRSNGYYIQVSHREDWDQMKSEVDGLIKRLSQKPLALKLGHHASPVGILNTYREKDLSLMEAVRRFEAGQS
jgi:hypothetical protein